MADKKQKLLPPPSGARLPTVSASRPSLPALPTSSGASPFWNSPTEVVRRDTVYIAQYADKLRAMADQASAFRELIDKRDDLGLALARIHSLPERAEHAFQMGRLNMASELRCAQLQHQLDEVNAKIRLAAAQMQFAQYQPQPAEPPPPPAPVGLTPSDVQKVAQIMPDMKPETIEALVLALGGFMAEKSK